MAKREEVSVEGEGWVVMHHPDIPDSYSSQTAAAFEEVYKAKGFVLADEPKPAAAKTSQKEG